MRGLVIIAVLTAGLPARADQAARVLAVRGVAYVIDEAKVEADLLPGMAIVPPSTIVTKEETAVRMRMADGTIVSLGASTRMTLAGFNLQEKKRRRATFKITVGRLWAKVTDWIGGDTRYEVETPNAVVGIRGTEFVVHFDEGGLTSVMVVGGTVEMRDAARELAEKIGPFLAGVFSGEGAIEVREVTLDELRVAAADVAIGPQLSEEELDALKKKKRRRGDGADELRPLPFGLLPRDTPPPGDLPLEPGVGQSRSTGRLEVRDD